MKAMVSAKRIGQLAVCLLMLFSFGWVQPVAAQVEEPLPPGQPGLLQPNEPPRPGTEYDPGTGNYFASGNSLAAESALLGTGGPDQYGYTWNDRPPTVGLTPAAGAWRPYRTPPVTIMVRLHCLLLSNITKTPIPACIFRSMVSWLSIMLIHGKPSSTRRTPIPPNDVIAPYWSPSYLASSSKVYYRSFGTAP